MLILQISYSRRLNLIGCLICIGLLSFAYYLECSKDLMPCSLCILQRFVFVWLALLFLVAFLHDPKCLGIRIYGLLTAIIAALGALLAARQIWLALQPHAPAEICLPGLSYMLTHLPLNQVISSMFMGSDDCGVVQWRFLYLSLAQWSLLCFIGFCLLGTLQFFLGISDNPTDRK